ncbi:MAG: CBS domain-containing protein [Rhodospirillales bacterium]|nr:CBS domain-containing protein [Rhodospirillales bacterium]
MPSHAAISEEFMIFSPDMEVEKALKELKKKKQDAAIVIGEDGQVEGEFSLQSVMKNLLPVSVAMADGIQLDVTVRAAPGIAKRLKKVYPLKVADLMERKIHAIAPEMPIWEAVNHLVNTCAPLWVIERESGKCLGVITAQSAMDELKRLQESER